MTAIIMAAGQEIIFFGKGQLRYDLITLAPGSCTFYESFLKDEMAKQTFSLAATCCNFVVLGVMCIAALVIAYTLRGMHATLQGH